MLLKLIPPLFFFFFTQPALAETKPRIEPRDHDDSRSVVNFIFGLCVGIPALCIIPCIGCCVIARREAHKNRERGRRRAGRPNRPASWNQHARNR